MKGQINNGETPCVMYVSMYKTQPFLAWPAQKTVIKDRPDLGNEACGQQECRTLPRLLGASPAQECSGLCTNIRIQLL